ncbi:hypothetical protein [Paenibacillus illinoisensis]|uniref:hypothetical protein n=1 Tax=Paenibacillus illinoisensis TaxID=59845 RepID=UPI002896EC62|nr:hypothetical protein [Paenibacillus illinoisensis]
MNESDSIKEMDNLHNFSQDSEAKRLYEDRQKYLHDEASKLESAKMAGVKQVAKNLLEMNLELSIIAKATGLTEQVIKNL